MLAGALVTGSFLSNAYYPLTYMALGIAAAGLLGSPLWARLESTTGDPSTSSPQSEPRTSGRGVTRLRRGVR
jgi:hypothetical protein